MCVYYRARPASGPKGQPADSPPEEWCEKEHDFFECLCMWNGKTSRGEEGHSCGVECPDYTESVAIID